MKKTLFVFGHGFSASALAKRLIPEGWTIYGTTRSPDKFAKLEALGVTPLLWPGSDITKALDEASHLLLSAAPNAEGDPVLQALREDITRRQSQFEWVGYLSTTGVYGDHQGGWVNEDTALTPSTTRGQYRVQAEADWQAIDLPLHIFRLAGIYGTGRGPFAKVRKGTARQVIKENQVFSRIHAEDIAQVLTASIARPNAGAIYNLCDDLAAPPEDVIGYAAELLGVTLPPAEDYATADMTPMARSFYAESKRVSNARIKAELGVMLKYPDYKVGLQALLAEEKDG